MGVPVNPYPPTPSSLSLLLWNKSAWIQPPTPNPQLPTPTPQPHLPFPWFYKIEMCGSSKMAWIDAVRTTRYSLILMLCCDVSTFLVKQGVPSDEDLEWLYASCSLYEKAIRSIAN